MFLFAARDKSTGKLVSGITNPSKRFWQRQASCQQAIDNANAERRRWEHIRKRRGELELVAFELVEVKKGG